MRRSKRRIGTGGSQAVKSAARVLDIFELLLQEPRGFSLTEISKRLGVPGSSAHALVQTLARRGYLVRDDELVIRLGPKLCQYARAFADGLELVSIADPIMQQVSQLCGQTVSLAVPEGHEVVFIHKRIAGGTLHVFNPVGTRLPAHATGLGKSILALLPPEELDLLYPSPYLPPSTPNTITDKAELLLLLHRVRQEGVAYDREESNLGIFAVGSAIRDLRGRPIAAISIALPAAQANEALEPRWAALTKAAAAAISYHLGYAVPGSSGMPNANMLARAWERGVYSVEEE